MNTGLNIYVIVNVMKFKTIAIFLHGGHSNLEKSMIFRQVVCEVLVGTKM